MNKAPTKDTFHRKHACTSIGCNMTFGTKGKTNAHSLMYLHAKNVHGITISIGCFTSCNYIAGE